MFIAKLKALDIKFLITCILIIAFYAWIIKTTFSDDMSPILKEDLIWIINNILILIINLGLFCYFDSYLFLNFKAARRILNDSEDQVQSFQKISNLTNFAILILLQLWINLILSNMKIFEYNILIHYFVPFLISFNLMEMIREDQFEGSPSPSPSPLTVFCNFFVIYLMIIVIQNVITTRI